MMTSILLPLISDFYPDLSVLSFTNKIKAKGLPAVFAAFDSSQLSQLFMFLALLIPVLNHFISEKNI